MEIPPIILLVRDELEHVAVTDSRANPTKTLVHGAHRAVEDVVERQSEPVRAVGSAAGKCLGRWHIEMGIWISPSHIHVIIGRRHVSDVCVVGHRQSLNAGQSILSGRVVLVTIRGVVVVVLWLFVFMAAFLIVRRVVSRLFSTVTSGGLDSKKGFPKCQGNQLDKVCGLEAQMDVVDNTIAEKVCSLIEKL